MEEATEPQVLPFADLVGDVPVLDTDGATWWLVGSVCHVCDDRAFPARRVCGRCGADDVGPAVLGASGILYSYATVHVSSTRQTPYTLGYVDLDTGPRVLATIGGAPADGSPRTGTTLDVDLPVVLRVTDDGWEFVPADGAGTDGGGVA